MKKYVKPDCEVIKIQHSSALLQGSPGGELEYVRPKGDTFISEISNTY